MAQAIKTFRRVSEDDLLPTRTARQNDPAWDIQDKSMRRERFNRNGGRKPVRHDRSSVRYLGLDLEWFG